MALLPPPPPLLLLLAGSTRNPAFQNGNFGYDPTRGHFDNEGNPGMALILDQIGLNARTMDDIILVDAALSGYTVEDVYPNPKAATELRVGVPLYPFVRSYVPAGRHQFPCFLCANFVSALALHLRSDTSSLFCFTQRSAVRLDCVKVVTTLSATLSIQKRSCQARSKCRSMMLERQRSPKLV